MPLSRKFMQARYSYTLVSIFKRLKTPSKASPRPILSFMPPLHPFSAAETRKKRSLGN